MYWFCHTLTWICHGCTCAPHPEPPSHLPPHSSAPALSTLYHASNPDWWFVSHMIIYMFQWHSPISSCPCPLLQSPKDCSIHLCLFCCTPMFIAALFTIARTWKQPRCQPADEWIRKLWYIYIMEYYSAIKKNTFESVLMRWMKPGLLSIRNWEIIYKDICVQYFKKYT